MGVLRQKQCDSAEVRNRTWLQSRMLGRATVVLFSCFLLLPFKCLSAEEPEDWTTETELDAAKVTELLQLLEPEDGTLWRTIPWKISMLGGQREAAQQGKPLFIWAMDGHPLGCT